MQILLARAVIFILNYIAVTAQERYVTRANKLALALMAEAKKARRCSV